MSDTIEAMAKRPMEPFAGRIDRAHRAALEALAHDLNAVRADGRTDWTWTEALRLTSRAGMPAVRRRYKIQKI